VAGVIHLANRGFFGDQPTSIVCTLTGHGLKDPDYALDAAPDLTPAPPIPDAILERAGLPAFSD
jgi:threonine synthase